MASIDSYTRPDWPGGELAMTGPSVDAEAGHLPVRGDLAHIKLAGRFFVPHYAVPMPHRAAASGATLHAAPDPQAAQIGTIAPGAIFEVLDIAGNWAWGQVAATFPGEEGLVGYVAMAGLERAEP